MLETVPLTQRAQAIEESIASTIQVPRGRSSFRHADALRGGIGLLVLDGLLVRRVGVGGNYGAELLGEGDLLRPWQGEDADAALSRTTGWRVLQPTRLAVLDERVAQRFGRYPTLTGALVGRALERSRNLAVNMAIVHHPRVDTRLEMLLWQLAYRWGQVRTDGVVMPLHLTHSMLADLVAARRPTVTTALAELTRGGVLRARQRGWLLSGKPPGELLALRREA